MDTLASLIGAALPALVPWVFAFAFMTAFELLVPREAQTLGGRLPGLMFWSLWLPVSAAVHWAYAGAWAALGLSPLLHLPLDFGWAGLVAPVLAPVAGAVLYDFFFYWCHRAEHAFLWRFHAVHHAIRDLNAVNAYHHVTEPAIQLVLLMIPASLVAPPSGGAAAWVVLLIYLQSSFIHSPTRFHLGWLGRWIVDNRFHRIHHSLEERHFDRNFGAFTTIWDRLFGTAHFPGRDEWPAVGIAGVDSPRTLRQWLTLPFGPPFRAPAPRTEPLPAGLTPDRAG